MPELLVRTVDNVNSSDVYLDVKLTKRGDVIDVRPDGWPWSSAEKTLPFWRIFVMPSETQASAESLLTPELPSQITTVSDPMLQARGFFLNLDDPTLPADLAAYIADASRVKASFVVSLPTIAAWSQQRPARADPNVVG